MAEKNGRSRFMVGLASLLGRLLAFVYLGGMAIALLAFNYQYARENSFMDWLVFGQVVPSLKATVWPYYLVMSLREQPGHQPVRVRLSNSLDEFRERDIPRYYPVLLDYLEPFDKLHVDWPDENADIDSLSVTKSVDGQVVIRAHVWLAESPDYTGPTVPVAVRMNDFDTDGRVDRITYCFPGKQPYSGNTEDDVWANRLWERCLGLIFLYGEPFD